MSLRTAAIQLLPEHLINQIAAGEVIERPASIVKELLENSLDAEATRIDLEIEDGGLKSIRVADNGFGIPPGQLALAMTRHATSKLRTLEDLARISSLGFRGEGLSSIASVSRVVLISRTADTEHGTKIDGQSAGLTPVAHPVGTTVEVRDLFYNASVRRKYLRSERTELYQVLQVVRSYALSRYGVEFRLRHNQRQLLSYARARDGSQQRRVAEVCGLRFLKHASEVLAETGGIRVRGWVGAPAVARRQADAQFLFVNDRMIRDAKINHAVRQAYVDRLAPGRFPCYVLFLEMDPVLVDVNVHPAKAEVRISEPRMVHDFVYATVHRALNDCQGQAQAPASRRPSPIPNLAAARGGGGVAEARLLYAATAEPPPEPGCAAALGQVCGNFIVARNDAGLLLIDRETAFEQMSYQQLNSPRPQEIRPLLIPLSADVSQGTADTIEHRAGLLHRVGLHIDRVGPRTVMLRRVPEPLADCDLAGLVAAVAPVLTGKTNEQLFERLCRTLAHYAARHQPPLTSSEGITGFLKKLESHMRLFPGAQPGWILLDAAALSRLIAAGKG